MYYIMHLLHTIRRGALWGRANQPGGEREGGREPGGGGRPKDRPYNSSENRGMKCTDYKLRIINLTKQMGLKGPFKGILIFLIFDFRNEIIPSRWYGVKSRFFKSFSSRSG
jgi:hypothetical protein